MKTLKLWFTFLSFSLSNLVAYRVDLLLRLIGMVWSVGFMILVLALPYRYTDTIAGWDQHEIFIVIGMYYLMNGLSWMLFKDGIFRIEDKVKYGLMDTVLLKPVGSIFMTAFFEVDVSRLADAVVGVIIICHQVVVAGISIDPVRLLAVTVSCVSGLAVVFSLYLSANTLSFWTTEAYIGHVSNPIFTVAKYPVDLWGEKVAQFFYWVVPIGLMSSVPAGILVGKLSVEWAIFSVMVSMVWVAGSRLLWGVALTKYSGIGS